MQQRTFEEVRESLRGKVILVANRGIPARRISRSIRERFEAIAAITATDIDKTEPAAASAQESGLGFCERRQQLSEALRRSRHHLHRRYGRSDAPPRQ